MLKILPRIQISVLSKKQQEYDAGNGKTFVYTKPKLFGFITDLPRDAAGIVSTTLKKKKYITITFNRSIYGSFNACGSTHFK